MLQEFLMKKMLNAKLAQLPEEEREKVLKAIEDNPEFFKKIALELETAMKSGKNQMAALMEVVQKYEEELKKLM